MWNQARSTITITLSLALITSLAAIQTDEKCDFCICHLISSDSGEMVPVTTNMMVLNCTATGPSPEDNTVRLPILSSFLNHSKTATYTSAEFRHNNISVVRTLGLAYINYLYLDDNNIDIIYDNAFESMNSTLQELHLSHNNIKGLRFRVLQSLRALQVLDLSYNKFTVLDFNDFNFKDKLRVILLAHNDISTIKHNSNNVGRLQMLDLGSNKIVRLNDKIFPVMSKLTVLDLSNNTIVNIDQESFREFTSLNTFNLSYNNISNLYLNPLTSVKVLRLGHNIVNNLKEVVRAFPNVEELHLQANGLSTLDGFADSSKLKIFNLSANNFTAFPARRFPNMTLLDLSSNMLESVPDGLTGEFLPSLEYLWLDNNPIQNLQFPQNKDDRAQTQFQNLRRLSVSRMPRLAVLSATALRNVVAMRANRETEGCQGVPCGGGLLLVVSHNPMLASIEKGALDNIQFSEVDLSYNNLETLPEDLLNWTRVPSVDLQGNPWDCHCKNGWLLDTVVTHLYKTGRTEKLYELRCASPSPFRDHLMVHFFNWTQNAFCTDMASYKMKGANREDVKTSVNMSSSEGMLIAVGVLGTIFLVLVISGLVYHFRYVKAKRNRNRRF